MAGGSTKAVYAAIFGNTAVMCAKFTAFALTGSAAMLSEGIHSLADVGNQCLLALGIHKSNQPATDEHPYGYARDRFIWALISAVGIFFLGCGVTVYHGVHSLLHPKPFEGSVAVLAGVLIFSLLAEGATFVVALKAVNAARGKRSVIEYLGHSDDPMGAAVLLEDGAAVLGVLIAGVCITLSVITGSSVWDAIGSILIGLMLGLVAILLVRRNRELLLGEAPDPTVVKKIADIIRTRPEVDRVKDVKAVVLGTGALRFKAEVEFDGKVIAEQQIKRTNLGAVWRSLESEADLHAYLSEFGEAIVDDVGKAVDRIEKAVGKAVPGVAHVDLEAD